MQIDVEDRRLALRLGNDMVVPEFFRRVCVVRSWLCLLLGWWKSECVGAEASRRNFVRRAVGIDKDGVANLLNLFVALRRMCGPARNAMNQRCGDVVRIDGVVREDPERVLGAGLVGAFCCL